MASATASVIDVADEIRSALVRGAAGTRGFRGARRARAVRGARGVRGARRSSVPLNGSAFLTRAARAPCRRGQDTDATDETDDLMDDLAEEHTSGRTANEVVRWGLFSAAVVPLVMLLSGSSLLGALGMAAGLTTVTAACRALLLQSERARTQRARGRFGLPRPEPHRGRHGRTGMGLHRGGRHSGQP
jgi:hypothetical protein